AVGLHPRHPADEDAAGLAVGVVGQGERHVVGHHCDAVRGREGLVVDRDGGPDKSEHNHQEQGGEEPLGGGRQLRHPASLTVVVVPQRASPTKKFRTATTTSVVRTASPTATPTAAGSAEAVKP